VVSIRGLALPAQQMNKSAESSGRPSPPSNREKWFERPQRNDHPPDFGSMPDMGETELA
jgi:hypothetical protein